MELGGALAPSPNRPQPISLARQTVGKFNHLLIQAQLIGFEECSQTLCLIPEMADSRLKCG
jgi:hypothetical protein